MKRVQVSTYLTENLAKKASARGGQKGYISVSAYIRYLIMQDLKQESA